MRSTALKFLLPSPLPSSQSVAGAVYLPVILLMTIQKAGYDERGGEL